MPRLSKIGAAALAAFGWTGLSTVTASYLVVAGGGGAQTGGGGAGGLLTSTTTLNPTLSYTVIVGAGGVSGVGSGTIPGGNGGNSTFNSVTAIGGGGSGSDNVAGTAGGSGGGAGWWNFATSPGAGTSGQGNAGGNGSGFYSLTAQRGGGGGGGAGAVGGNAGAGNGVGGNGGIGVASSITGTSTYYAGGGGGWGGTTAGTGGLGGGGNGVNGIGNPGTANTGGGAGGVQSQGGSGVVIISYPAPQKFGGGVVTTSGSNVIHTFNTSGTLSPLSSLTASYLIVAGGGAGGYGYDGSNGGKGGGGGAGGLLTGSGLTIDTNSNYLVTVGAGGATRTSTGQGSNGSNSLFSGYATTAVGGGGGAGGTGTQNGVAGGSGGGGGAYAAGSGIGGTGTSGQGNAGGVSTTSVETTGGGGGAGAVGGAGNASTKVSGSGGIGVASSISGSSVYYAGGGGGSSDGGVGAGATAGAGGNGGGGSGSAYNGAAGGPLASGTVNTGGGGGGSIAATNGAGGSGVVIISYAGSVQQMAGGTVTIVGGNVIHTFTSSGYLAPLKFVGNSLRWRASNSAYLNRTIGTATNAAICTTSFWVKRGKLGTQLNIMGAGQTSGTNYSQFVFSPSTDTLNIGDGTSGTGLVTNQVFRDPAAWYHIVYVYDSTQSTSTNRLKLYVNGVQVTSFASVTYPSLNVATLNNTSGYVMALGNIWYNGAPGGYYFDGYMTEINFVDGQALGPNAFGAFNSYGVWQPITYGGSYGTNGFYLPFTNKTSTTTLGYDFSPAGNNWTTNNFSLTTGSTYDSMTDVPTLTSATTANYCVGNPLDTYGDNSYLVDGNLQFSTTANVNGTICSRATFGVSSGKWYWEGTAVAVATNRPYAAIGIDGYKTNIWAIAPSQGTLNYCYGVNGQKIINGTGSAYGATITGGDVVGIAFDADAGTITFYKNGTSQGLISSLTTGVPYAPFCSLYIDVASSPRNSGWYMNFGQQPFAYTPPTGFLPLNTYNL